MKLKDPIIFRELFTSFIIEGEIPKTILVNGERYELMIVFDSKPLRYAIKGAHDLLNAVITPVQ